VTEDLKTQKDAACAELPAEECAILRPGDTLILRYTRITAQTAATLREQFAERLPGVKVAIVQADGMAVQHAESADRG
jgi:hypothetical protein